MAKPSKYKPEYCALLNEHMAKGLSFEAFAGLLSVNRQTLYNWRTKFPEFQEAHSIAIEKCRLFWEKVGLDGLYTITEYDEKGKPSQKKILNPVMWIFNMKNRFREEWGERAESPDDGAMDVKTAKSIAEQYKALKESEK